MDQTAIEDLGSHHLVKKRTIIKDRVGCVRYTAFSVTNKAFEFLFLIIGPPRMIYLQKDLFLELKLPREMRELEIVRKIIIF